MQGACVWYNNVRSGYVTSGTKLGCGSEEMICEIMKSHDLKCIGEILYIVRLLAKRINTWNDKKKFNKHV